MAPRKRSSVLTTEPVQAPSTASKRRKQTKKSDCNDKNECKINSISKPLSQLPVERKFSSPNKSSRAVKSKQPRFSKKSLQNQNESEVEKAKLESINVNDMNVEQLLALGEKSGGVDLSHSKHDDFDDSSESDMSDLEEVKNDVILEPVIPKEGVDITLEAPNLFNKRQKKGFDWEAHLKRQLIRVRKDLQLLMHKVHVLCWIAHLRFVNNTLNDPSLMESCSSLIKTKNLYPSKYSDLNYLEGILKWFHKNIELKKDVADPLCTGGLFKELKYQVDKKQAFSNRTFVFIFILLLRVLGLKARIVISFQVLPVRPSIQELYGDVLKARSEKLKLKRCLSSLESSEENSKTENAKDLPESVEKSSNKQKSKRKSVVSSSEETNLKKKRTEKEDKTVPKLKEDNSDDDFESEHFKPVSKSGRRKQKPKSELEQIELKSNFKRKSRGSTVDNKKEVKVDVNNEEEDDNDFKPVSLSKKSKKRTEKKSEVSGKESQEKKEGSDVWAEVYLEAEEKWICVDVPRQKIHCIGEIYVKATHPVAYIVACNNDHTLKDVTKRYVPNWHSDTRKRRVDEEWWNDTMKPYLPPQTAQNKEEDEDINRQLMDKPLPSSISEFKDHPLYALKRHLLKFEAIYPPDAPTLGFVRGEPVYARECVHTLHSREMWYKQARLVRVKEEPYKIVKARPKYDKVSTTAMTGEVKKDLPLELFGNWQTEDYIPPIATDGKVPRNEYGNVDLFKPCMLPIGTVHLQIPALNRIAKKLDIDCAPATVGFDFHSGGSHPVFDGFVVCEEFKDVLLDAWNKEIDESSKKEAEKKDKRVYGNWKRLIRGLLIREKLKIKYAFGENSDNEDESKPLASKASTSKQINNK